MISKEIEDKLEHWDLFVKDGYILTTGKSWPQSLKGDIALYSEYKHTWSVRDVTRFQVCNNTDTPHIDWYNTGIEIDNDKFIEYMDLFRDMVTHMNYVDHLIELINNLKEKRNDLV
jgi:hypothetical protein